MKDKNNDPNQKVIINRPASDSSTEPLMETIYEGKLKKIPPEIALHQIMETAWSTENDCAIIKVKAQTDPADMEREIRAAVADDQDLAAFVESYLSASPYGQRMAAARLINELMD